MSKETLEWLRSNILIGFTEKLGTAWWARKAEGNHYDGPVPLEDVETRLFNWDAVPQPLYIAADDGVSFREVPGKIAWERSDNHHVMGVFSDGYRGHQYRPWLLNNVSNLLDDDLSIGSAGLLRDGAVAWVSVEVPENLSTPSGIEYRPKLVACTSFDGSLATTYKRTVTRVQCDNTLFAGITGGNSRLKVKHSKNSLGRLADVREALEIVHSISDDFEKEVEALVARSFDDSAFERLVDDLAPMPSEKDASSRAITFAETKRSELWRLWNHDDRVSPYKGNAFGAYQAFNTYAQHHAIVRGAFRAERNMLRTLTGGVGQDDQDVLDAIAKVALV